MFENMETRSLMEVDGGGVIAPIIPHYFVSKILAWFVSRI